MCGFFCKQDQKTILKQGYGVVARAVHGIYKATISKLIGNACRFDPSCSDYALEAIERYGWMRGVVLALKRFVRCHPWCPGGRDAVP